MKSVYLIGIILCFLLIGGIKHSYAGHYKQTDCSAQLKTAQPPHLQLAIPDKEHAVIKNRASADVYEYVITIDDNEEDDHTISARKYVLLVSCFFALSYAFILSSLFSSIKDRLPYCGHLANASSCKYITQRVLRL
ncbi:hypothetical protein ACFQ3S_00495 [Mucilaginibacter terrae]